MSSYASRHNQHQKQGGSSGKTTHDEIARAAFSLYQKHGSQDGHDVQNWLDAEAHVQAHHASTMHGIQSAAKSSGPSTR